MQKLALAFFILAAVASLSTTPASAEIKYPWGPTWRCWRWRQKLRLLHSEQCRATMFGMGDFCEANLFCPGSASDNSQSKHKRQHLLRAVEVIK